MRDVVSEIADVRLAQYVMGTVVEVSVTPVCGEEHALGAAALALREFERIELLFSRFNPSSELSRVNIQAATRPVEVSDEFFALTERGLQYSRYLSGAFSISLQPLVSLWERAAQVGWLPSYRQIEAVRCLCDPGGVILDPKRRSLSFALPGTSLNFDGLAKGYAVDRARDVLSHQGIAHAIVNAGSSSMAALYPEKRPAQWRLAVRHPVDPIRSVACLEPASPAISTSGTGDRGFRIEGQWYSHVIDPSSGFPLRQLASATAIGEYAELMEVAAKLLLLYGCKRGLSVCERLGWAVDGLTVIRQTSGDLAIEYPDHLAVKIESEYDPDTACAH